MKKYIGELFDLKELYYKVFGYVAPPFPTADLESQITANSVLGTVEALVEQYKKTVLGTEIIMPLSLSIPNKKIWELKTEPMVSIKGGNKIIRRFPNRNKKGGSIKELWSSDDYNINIKGVLTNFLDETYPEDQVNQLREICEYKGSIKVSNALCRLFGVEWLAITSYDLPFTQGLPVQVFNINAYSDQLFDSLLIEQ